MNTKLQLISVLAAGLALQGAAMPTEAEVEKAVPKVERMLASEKVALASGKMTCAEVAAAAMKLAAGADDEAAKLVLMKGAFILHVKDGDLEKAVKTMNALETAIADMPPQIVTNIIETALLGLPDKTTNATRLYRLIDAGSVKRKGSYQNRAQKAVSKRYFVTKEEIWRLLSSAQPRQKIAVPQRDEPAELPVFTNPAEAQRKAKELGLWMFVYNMPCSRTDTFSSSSYFLKSLSKHCVFVHVNGFGSESAECRWERSTCWPCCRILDSDGNLVSSVATWSGMPNCEVSGQKMIEIFNGFMKACEIMPAAFDVVERNPNEIGLAKMHEALSSLPESFVNIAYLKWAELLVKADRSDDSGWRACYSYAAKILPLQEAFYRSDDCSFNNGYWRAKRDKEKYHDFLSGIDRVVLERRISASDDIRKRITAIDEQSLSDEARDRLAYLRQEVEKSSERLDGIQRDLLTFEKQSEQKENAHEIDSKPRVADGKGAEVIGGCTRSYSVKTNDFKAKLTGVAIIEGGRMHEFEARAKKAEFQDPNFLIEIPYGKAVCFRVEYDFPEGYQAYVWARDKRTEKQDGDGCYFGSNASCLYAGEGVAYGFLVAHGLKRGKTCTLLELAVRTSAVPKPEGFPREWDLGPFPVNIKFYGQDVGQSVVDVSSSTSQRKISVEKVEQRQQLREIQKEFQRVRALKDSSPAVQKAVESIWKGMIKVPGRDYWLSATELTQEQWEPIMEFNLSEHKGAKLPVECVSRDDCDVFLEKLNHTKEVSSSGFEFRLPELEEWKYAAWAGSAGNGSWIKPGMIGNVLDMAWVKENSSNETHAVAMKAANAFGFYDMLGNVWEWLAGDAPGGRGALKGCAFSQVADKCTWNQNLYLSKIQRVPFCGLRLAAHKKDFLWQPLSGGLRRSGSASDRSQAGQKAELRQEIVNGYAWSYRVNNGEAEIVAEKDGKPCCAVSPTPIGSISIPSTLGGARVTSIGQEAFRDCKELKMVTIPQSVTNIGVLAFYSCDIKSVNILASVKSIGTQAFSDNSELMSFSVEESNPSYSSRNGLLCTKDGATLISGTSGDVEIPSSVTSIGDWAFTGRRQLTSVMIPSSVTNIGRTAFRWCSGLKAITIPPAVTRLDSNVFRDCSGLTSVVIPSNVTSIGWCAFWKCSGLKSVTIPSSVTIIRGNAFGCCGKLTSVTIPWGVTGIAKNAFYGCGGLSSVTMLGERPSAPRNIFSKCGKLKSIHVPANAKSWTGMTEWQGIPIVFDAE